MPWSACPARWGRGSPMRLLARGLSVTSAGNRCGGRRPGAGQSWTGIIAEGVDARTGSRTRPALRARLTPRRRITARPRGHTGDRGRRSGKHGGQDGGDGQAAGGLCRQGAVPGDQYSHYLDIDQIAATLDDPSRLLGLQFLRPGQYHETAGNRPRPRGHIRTPRWPPASPWPGGWERSRSWPGVCDGFIGNRISRALPRRRPKLEIVPVTARYPLGGGAYRPSVRAGWAMSMRAPYDGAGPLFFGLDIAQPRGRRQGREHPRPGAALIPDRRPVGP